MALNPTTWRELGLRFFVVSVPRSIERRERMRRRLSQAGAPFDFVDAIDGQDTAAVERAYMCDPSAAPRIYGRRPRDITSREIACTLSHMSAIRQAYRAGLDYALICEDDLEIGDVSAAEMATILSAMPRDAACLQLCVTPAACVRRLVEYHSSTGLSFALKRRNQPTRLHESFFDRSICHCATAYIVTAPGMKSVCETYFRDTTAVFPCSDDEFRTNGGLLADRFIYEISVGEETNGYVYCIPTFTFEALDSLLHPEALGEHAEARSVALELRAAVRCGARV